MNRKGNYDLNPSEQIDGNYDGECVGCDLWAPVNDLGLCDDCNAKLERDLIRQRDWGHSATAFAVPAEKFEELRQIIAEYGEKLELIAPEKQKRGTQVSTRKRSNKGQSS